MLFIIVSNYKILCFLLCISKYVYIYLYSDKENNLKL